MNTVSIKKEQYLYQGLKNLTKMSRKAYKGNSINWATASFSFKMQKKVLRYQY